MREIHCSICFVLSDTTNSEISCCYISVYPLHDKCSYQKEDIFTGIFFASSASLIFLFSNCCIFPCIFGIALARFAEREEAKKREREARQDLDNAILKRGETYVARHGEVSIFDALNTDYKELAKKEEDFSCAICLVEFEDNDAVTELKCHNNHVFHSECIV